MPVAAMGIAGNLWFHQDWVSCLPFVDVMMQARSWVATDASVDLDYSRDNCRLTVPFTQEGYPRSIPWYDVAQQKNLKVCTVVLTGMHKTWFPFGEYTLLFEGKGHVRLRWIGQFTNPQWRHEIDGSGGQKTYAFRLDTLQATDSYGYSNGMALHITRSDSTDPIRNIRLILPGYRDYYQSNQNSPWNPQFLNDMKTFSVVRFMDWNNTNRNTDSLWSQRTPKSHFCQTSYNEDAARFWENEVAYEWMIELGNTLRRDIWITVPTYAGFNEDYLRNLAVLVRDNLDPQLRCWVEWSNETWGGVPGGPVDAFNKVCKVIGPQVDTSPRAGRGGAEYRFQTYMAVRVFKVFNEVFGTQADSRLVRVLAGWQGSSYVNGEILWAYRDTVCYNPWKIKGDVFAVAPYFGGGNTLTNPLSPLVYDDIARIGRESADLRDQIATVAPELRLAMYEGGKDIRPGFPRSDSRLYDIYNVYLDTLDNHFTLMNQYVAIADNQRWDWGAKLYAGQPLDGAPEYRALYDYAVASGQYNPADTVALTAVAQPAAREVGRLRKTASSARPQALYDLAGRRLSGAPGARLQSTAGIRIVEQRSTTTLVARPR